MTIQLFVSPIRAPIGGGVTKTMVLRVALTIAAFSMAIVPVFAGENPVLRGDIAARSDVLTLGDLVEGLPGPAATQPVFRAPALGDLGHDPGEAHRRCRIRTRDHADRDGRARRGPRHARRPPDRTGRDRGCSEADAGDPGGRRSAPPLDRVRGQLPPFSSRPISRRP